MSGREVKMGGRQCWEWEGGEDGRAAMLGDGLCWEVVGGRGSVGEKVGETEKIVSKERCKYTVN